MKEKKETEDSYLTEFELEGTQAEEDTSYNSGIILDRPLLIAWRNL